MSTRSSFNFAAKQIGEYRKYLGKAAGPAVRQIAEEVKTDVVASRPGKGVPRDEGVLAASVEAQGPYQSRRGVAARLVAGGAAAEYALVQHERLDFHHDVGEARYLVRGVERWKPDGSAAMAGLKANAEAAARILERRAAAQRLVDQRRSEAARRGWVTRRTRSQ